MIETCNPDELEFRLIQVALAVADHVKAPPPLLPTLICWGGGTCNPIVYANDNCAGDVENTGGTEVCAVMKVIASLPVAVSTMI